MHNYQEDKCRIRIVYFVLFAGYHKNMTCLPVIKWIMSTVTKMATHSKRTLHCPRNDNIMPNISFVLAGAPRNSTIWQNDKHIMQTNQETLSFTSKYGLILKPGKIGNWKKAYVRWLLKFFLRFLNRRSAHKSPALPSSIFVILR